MTLKKTQLKNEWYEKTREQSLAELDSGFDGLSFKEAEKRLSDYGPNKLAEEERAPLFQIFVHQFKDPLIYILLAAGLVAVFLQDIIDAGVILAVVLLNAVIGFSQEYKAEESIRSLKKLLAPHAVVVREGAEHEIDAEDIVAGDIVVLQSGQKIPADLRLLWAKEFQVDESAFTGESVPRYKHAEPIKEPDLGIFERDNMIYMGSIVSSGRANALCVSTGVSTELGKISEQVQKAQAVKTPLQGRVETLSRYIILFILGFGAVGFIIGAVQGKDFSLLILTIVAMAVAAIPEGLPVALTIALAVAVNRMAQKKAVIRYLPAVETLGSSTVIGSDKTGTLTKNEMTVRKIWAGGKVYEVQGSGYEPAGHITSDSRRINLSEEELLEKVLRIGLLVKESDLIEEQGRWKAHGDPTEVALVVSAIRGGINQEEEEAEYKQLDILPFESELQYMAILYQHNGSTYLFVKGATEKLLSFSTLVEGTGNEAGKVIGEANKFADEGLRVLGMAYREMAPGTTEITHNDVKELTFGGFQGMMDPPRPDAVKAVADAKVSGIRTIMITGDNERTAQSIARMMGIANNGDIALTGRDVDRMSEEELRETVKNVKVFARFSPQNKLQFVNALKANGEIVAVTGDGVNDAAALKAAHIGIAMGLTGTDVAKEASDMVVLDDNFASIYQAITEGRVAFDNIRKVVFFLLTTGLGLLIAIFLTMITGLPLIFLPAQILWMNLVTNGLQDVALAFEPKEKGVEQRKPRNPKEGVVNKTLARRLFILGLLIALGSLVIFILSEQMAGISLAHARTIALTTIVFAQFFHVVNARSERISVFKQNLLSNRFLFYSMMAAFIAQMSLLYVPFMRFLFRTTALTITELLVALALGSIVLIGSEIDKWQLRIKDQMA